MKVGPKYKIARRLGGDVFEKTQGQKFLLRESNRKSPQKRKFRGGSEFGIQMLEKQKVRYTYNLTEKQFSKYVKESLLKKKHNTDEILFVRLEKRLDNVIFRSGFAPTRQMARQVVSHGHIKVNGRKVTIPSIEVKVGDKISVKDSSKGKALFASLQEKSKDYTAPVWMTVDPSKMEIEIIGEPKYTRSEVSFDLQLVLEFYKR